MTWYVKRSDVNLTTEISVITPRTTDGGTDFPDEPRPSSCTPNNERYHRGHGSCHEWGIIRGPLVKNALMSQWTCPYWSGTEGRGWDDGQESTEARTVSSWDRTFSSSEQNLTRRQRKTS